ncbi:protein of unknown function [Paraburkholderia kururiensis]
MFPDPAGQESGTIPTAPRKRGSKRRIAADGRGIPITIAVTGINRHDSIALQSTPAAIPVVPAPMAKRTHAPAGCRRTSAMTSPAVGITRSHATPVSPIARRTAGNASDGIARWSSRFRQFASLDKLRVRFKWDLNIHVALPSLSDAISPSRFADELLATLNSMRGAWHLSEVTVL